MSVKINPMRKYVRPGGLPHFFCPGCGAAQVLQYFTRAVDDLGLDLVRWSQSGSGLHRSHPCVPARRHASRSPRPYTGMGNGYEAGKSELKVVVFAGDGDAVSIEATTSSTLPGGIWTLP